MRTNSRFFVKTDRGQYFVFVPDEEARSGFYLCDDDQNWDGGFGVAQSWQRVKASEVPRKVRNQLGWILREK